VARLAELTARRAAGLTADNAGARRVHTHALLTELPVATTDAQAQQGRAVADVLGDKLLGVGGGGVGYSVHLGRVLRGDA